MPAHKFHHGFGAVEGRAAIFFYFGINLMMVMGMAPVVGIPLPFISFGSSAQMAVMICIGILMSIDRKNRRTPGGW